MPTASSKGPAGERFFQLVLLLINIIQGIAIGALASTAIADVFKSGVPSADIVLRIIAAFFVIWLITFDYAVFYVPLWPPSTGAIDIFIIMLTGLSEYVMIYQIADPVEWIGLIALESFIAMIAYTHSRASIDRELRKRPDNSDMLISLKNHDAVSMRFTFALMIISFLLWELRYWVFIKPSCLDFFAPSVVIAYCSFILWRDNAFVAEHGGSA